MGVSSHVHAAAVLAPANNPCTNCIGDGLVLRVTLDRFREEKTFFYWCSNPRLSDLYLVADYAVSAPKAMWVGILNSLFVWTYDCFDIH